MKHFKEEFQLTTKETCNMFIDKQSKLKLCLNTELAFYKITNFIVKKCVALLIFTLSTEIIHSQSQQLFSIKSMNDLNTQQVQLVNDILSKSSYSYYYIVEFNNNLVMTHIPLQFSIPNIDPDYSNIEFKTRRQNIETSNRNMFYGTVDSDSECV
ncbi:MAG: hypothetical protein HOP11_13575 [Saprospiraceae bacterium]|nr:hypothetical protein [Saprospiraceae bacterium]